jgi:hypothetical protein
MSSLSEIYIKKETLETLLSVINKKTGDQAKGVKITVSLSDETNQYGQNVSTFVSQTKEQREAKKDRFFIGNGKTFWTKGETPVPTKKDENKKEPLSDIDDTLPF